jgi:hypothetical protein
VGCQARGLKRRVVKPVRSSLQVREIVGEVIFSREPNCNYSTLRIPIRTIVEALEGKWGSRRTVEQRRGTLPGVVHACGE